MSDKDRCPGKQLSKRCVFAIARGNMVWIDCEQLRSSYTCMKATLSPGNGAVGNTVQHTGIGLFQRHSRQERWEKQGCEFRVLFVQIAKLCRSIPHSLNMDLPLDFSGVALKKSEKCPSIGVSILCSAHIKLVVLWKKHTCSKDWCGSRFHPAGILLPLWCRTRHYTY